MTRLMRSSPPGHQGSHRSLVVPVTARAVDAAGLDAVIVPTVRPAQNLRTAVALARDTDACLVVLCSREALVDEVVDLMAEEPRVPGVALAVPADYEPLWQPFRTSDIAFAYANGYRRSDLSLKRNIGIAVARSLEWRRIIFLDDDVSDVDPEEVSNAVSALTDIPVTGLLATDFPDNSVVCHANRLTGGEQDIFLTGAALALNLANWTPFFPDIYNEDWFAIYNQVRRRAIGSAGSVYQTPYDPYSDWMRAVHEEFGDLLAEGLYNQIGHVDDAREICLERFWKTAIQQRIRFLDDLKFSLSELGYASARSAIEAARRHLGTVTAAVCAAFIRAWIEDQSTWQKWILSRPRIAELHEIFPTLGLQGEILPIRDLVR